MREESIQDESALCRFSTTILRTFITPGRLSVKAANTLVLSLVEFMTDPVDAEFLKYASRFLTPASFDDIVTERNVLHICGYPLCDRKPFRKVMGKELPQISYKPSAKLKHEASSYLRQYCTKQHFQSSMIYRAQLSDEAVWARAGITYIQNGAAEWEKNIKLLEDLIDSDSDDGSKAELDEQNRELSENDVKEVMQSLSSLKFKPGNEVIEAHNPEISAGKSTTQVTIRQKIEKVKEDRFEFSALDFQVAERDFQNTRKDNPQLAPTAAPKEDAAVAIEGYIVGSASKMRPPRSYVQLKERQEREQQELAQIAHE
ncbi:Rtr1/RPAP2 family-domain-containing protein [Lipomyces tetrasporus]|uniref:RNA polymerase II subunit B1 CTD phosphatase RPAP2 homolog n=1 Tax=Lipomyces tetrasporus TaxID=54092 RepID=A0AAD7QQB8_9ASCO|nr:Rtr1/RPAP2 family-domain-containing protein [Lipomyces tetrasporus]KAJ8099612.1 Rtr1/RPAP2 family-domain-containing protein [Lipomyces tetrasporus]